MYCAPSPRLCAIFLTFTSLCVQEGTKYALKLKNTGQRSYNGDGGMAKVKCSDGTTFTFSACSLSINGTNHLRGQIPQILYYRLAAQFLGHLLPIYVIDKFWGSSLWSRDG